MVTDRFVEMKEKAGKKVGITVDVQRFEESISTEELINKVSEISKQCDGVVVQLPLPKHINKDEVLNSIPTEKDVDVLSKHSFELFRAGEQKVLPPVVGAFREVLKRNQVSIDGKRVVIVGRGHLVGEPSEIWFTQKRSDVCVITRHSYPNEEELLEGIASETKEADIIVLGTGTPGLIKPEIIKDGVIILDAGTSEDKRVLRGDADATCEKKAALFTPVPGGIGPITVSLLMKNLVVLAKK